MICEAIHLLKIAESKLRLGAILPCLIRFFPSRSRRFNSYFSTALTIVLSGASK